MSSLGGKGLFGEVLSRSTVSGQGNGPAAPVRDHAGEVVAAISVSLLKARVKGGQSEKIAQAVMRAARAISGAMGYRSN